VDIRRKDRNEEYDQRKTSGTLQPRDQQSNRAGNFTKPGKENHRPRPGNPRGRHPNEVFLYRQEMSAGCQEEHDREAVARGSGPRRQSRHSGKPEAAKNQDRNNQNE
jgi:hypothetical protein